ncbi:MAG: hypothetical protein QOF15_2859 [Mycobacterium sp.]|nr:hypothetical protein [Mycobacterium sp.]
MIGYVAVLGLGYVLGTKAGRRRYEQIAGTYRAVTGSPVARSMIEGGRRKIANRISPDTGFVTLTEIDGQTTIIERGSEHSDHPDAQVEPPVNAARGGPQPLRR